jgi:7SK snRNA methylphosphate capping enzyme
MSASSSGCVEVRLQGMDSTGSAESQNAKKCGLTAPKSPTKFIRFPSKIHKLTKKKCLDRKLRYVCRNDGLSRRRKERSNIVLPKRFLLGGTITDPLNLNGLGEENDCLLADFSRTSTHGHNQIVSQYPAANITDPLCLNDNLAFDIKSKVTKCVSRREAMSGSGERCSQKDVDEPMQMVLCEPTKNSDCANIITDRELVLETVEDGSKMDGDEPKQLMHSDENLTSDNRAAHIATDQISNDCGIFNKSIEADMMDKIVSPVIPQSCQKRKKCHYLNKKPKKLGLIGDASLQIPAHTMQVKSKKFSEKYSNGNYLAYYGYRNSTKSDDPRVKLFSCDMFQGREVLDVGCNAGFVTISVAQAFHPRRILGLDIDSRLIEAAKRNVRHFVSRGLTERSQYPKLMETLYGPASTGLHIAPETSVSSQPYLFPHNIVFQVVCILLTFSSSTSVYVMPFSCPEFQFTWYSVFSSQLLITGGEN